MAGVAADYAALDEERVAQELMVLFELPTHLVVMEHLFVHSRMFPGIEVLV